jgi:hypothetical protein
VTEHTRPLLWAGSQRQLDDPPMGFWVAVPVVVRPLIVEVPRDLQDSDPFARAVVNLALAGVQRISDISALIGIQDLDFVNEVVRRLDDRGIVRVRSGFVDVLEQKADTEDDKPFRMRGAYEQHVWEVVQDMYSGALWPRVGTRFQTLTFDYDHHIVELGNPGRPAKRNFWQMPPGDAVDDPSPTAIKQAVLRHLADIRTVGIKHNKVGSEHLATLGRPERRPSFSARLAPGREEARLLVRLTAAGEHVSSIDPFEVGAWFELPQWTEQMLERSPRLRQLVINWAERSVSNRDRHPADSLAQDETTAGASPGPGDATLSRPAARQPLGDRNNLLLSLADRLREDIGQSPQRSLALSHDSHRDAETLIARWASLGFQTPRDFIRPIPALIERAAEGFPAELHVLFYAWSYLVDRAVGETLARQVPNLPALLSENAAGRTRTAIPDIRSLAPPMRSVPTESRN